MTLWFAFLLGTVIAIAAAVCGTLAYILVSLHRAGPLLVSRQGRRPFALARLATDPRRLRFRAAVRHSSRRPRWASSHS